MIQLMETESAEQRLLAKAKQGDRQAFAGLTVLYEESLTAFVTTRLGPQLKTKVDRADIVQDVLAAAFQSLSDFEPEDANSFFRWLCGIAQNRILHMARRHLRNRELSLEREIEARESSPSKMIRREERFNRLEAALEELSPDHRQVIILARIEGLPLKEIGSRMNRTPKAVSKLLRKALENLKAKFGDTESLSLPDRTFKSQGGAQ